jgi:hypothetical protein
LLIAAALWRRGPSHETGPVRRGIGLLLAALAMLYPLLGLAMGRPWSQAEVFGLMPEPTALGTLGLLLAVGARRMAWLSVIPAASLAIGAATLWLLTR